MPRSADTAPLVVSIVVNYGGLEDTLRCAQSLLSSAYGRHVVVVVDNGSPADDASRISAAFGDRVHVISSARNLGYGGGANLGLRWAVEEGAAYAWVLNNDTIVDPACIGRLVDAMAANPGFAILSPQITAPIGPEAPHGIWYSGGRVLLERAETRHSIGRIEGTAVVETEYIVGCAMFIRCAALAETGFFWEPLFLFWEDVELSLRMRAGGWRLGVVPNAGVRHEIHGTVPSRTLDFYHFRNALIVVRRFASRRTAASAFLFLVGGVARRWARALLRRAPAATASTRGLVAGIVFSFRSAAR